MANDAHEMLVFLRLAWISQQKQQFLPRDKLLILSGAAALTAGYLDVANRCHQLVVAHQPSHVLSRFSNMSEAMVDAEFQPFLRSLRKFCSFEQAEHLLQHASDVSPSASDDAFRNEYECADIARHLLDADDWSTATG